MNPNDHIWWLSTWSWYIQVMMFSCLYGSFNCTVLGRRVKRGRETVQDKQLYKYKRVEKGKRTRIKRRRWRRRTRRQDVRTTRGSEAGGEAGQNEKRGKQKEWDVYWAPAALCYEVSLVPQTEVMVLWKIDDTTLSRIHTHTHRPTQCVFISVHISRVTPLQLNLL